MSSWAGKCLRNLTIRFTTAKQVVEISMNTIPRYLSGIIGTNYRIIAAKIIYTLNVLEMMNENLNPPFPQLSVVLTKKSFSSNALALLNIMVKT